MNRVVRLAVPVSLCLLGVACALAATEWIVHRFYARLAPPSGDAAVQILLGNRTPDEALAIRLHPYMLYQNNPQFVRFGIKQHNSMGYRGPEVTACPQPGVIRILALGGSTTYGYLLRDASDAWPAQLARILTERLGRPVEVVNGGLPYAMSSDLLAHYIFQDRFLGARNNPELDGVAGGSASRPWWKSLAAPSISRRRTHEPGHRRRQFADVDGPPQPVDVIAAGPLAGGRVLRRR